MKTNFLESRQKDFIILETYFSPKRSSGEFYPFKFQGEDSRFFEIGGTNGESEK